MRNAGRRCGNGSGAVKKNVPCNKTVGYRVTQGVLGATNLTLAGVKTAALGTADALLAVAAPETGGGTLAVAAVVTAYGVTSITGQTLTGMGQLISAFGDAEGGEGVAQMGDILSGPASGISTLVLTGDPSLAQRNANIESTYTAGAGLVGATSLKDKIASGINGALGIFGVTGAGCHP